MDSSDAVLEFKIDNSRPVELSDLATALSALADEYALYAAESSTEAVATDVRLFVRHLRDGSYIAELVALAPLALPFMENANTIVGFAGYVRTTIQALLGRLPTAPAASRRTLENLSKIVEPVAKDSGAQLNLNTTINADHVTVININSVEANALQNAARRDLEATEPPATGVHRDVILYLDQARRDPKSTAGDRGKIETIFPASVRLIFANETLKASIVRAEQNPFNFAYRVDVEVETVRGKPVLYKILAIYEEIDLSDEPGVA